MHAAANIRDPEISKVLDTTLKALAAADNDHGRLLAIRNCSERLQPFGDAASEARDLISDSAINVHKLSPDAVQVALVEGVNIAQLRSRSNGSHAPKPSAAREEPLPDDDWGDDDLNELNDKYALVSLGGHVRIMAFREKSPTYYRPADFRLLLSNRTKVDGRRHVPLANWWLSHPHRRHYDGICFEPGMEADVNGKRNLWTGFAVAARPGDCNLYLDFLREIICSGDRGHYDYLVNVMADAVQRPNKQGDVAVVVRGLEGVGKGFAINTFGHLFGQHFVPVTHASHLTGKFNAHLEHCSLLFADEAFFAGDRQHEAVLKALITESTFLIERKGA